MSLVINANDDSWWLLSRWNKQLITEYPDFKWSVLISPKNDRTQQKHQNYEFSVWWTSVQLARDFVEDLLKWNVFSSMSDVWADIRTYVPLQTTSIATQFISTTWTFIWWEVVWKKILFPLFLFYNDQSSSYSSSVVHYIQIKVWLLHSDWSISYITTLVDWQFTSNFYRENWKSFEQTFEYNWQWMVAQAGDRPIVSVYWYKISWWMWNDRYWWIYRWKQWSTDNKLEMHAVQISVE